MSNSFLKK